MLVADAHAAAATGLERAAAHARQGVQCALAARAALAALGPELAATAEIANARAAICLAEANPAAALATVQDVLNGITPANSYTTVVEANILAAIAHRELGDQCCHHRHRRRLGPS